MPVKLWCAVLWWETVRMDENWQVSERSEMRFSQLQTFSVTSYHHMQNVPPLNACHFCTAFPCIFLHCQILRGKKKSDNRMYVCGRTPWIVDFCEGRFMTFMTNTSLLKKKKVVDVMHFTITFSNLHTHFIISLARPSKYERYSHIQISVAWFISGKSSLLSVSEDDNGVCIGPWWWHSS